MTLNISLKEHANDPQPTPTVAHCQTRLIGKGYSCGPYGADGHFGYYSDQATRRFQSHCGIGSDGVIGTVTLGKLDQSIAPASVSAVRFADDCYRRVMGQDDHPRPRYIYGYEVTDLSAPYPTAFDCSELVQWGIYQAVHTVWADGTFNQAPRCHLITVDQAMHTKGALLFVTSNGAPSGTHHVAVSMGNGTTAEARSSALGCGSWSAAGRFNLAGLPDVLKF